MLLIKTRREAAEAGESKYYTGRPCKNGHDGMRYTASGICCACNSLGAKKYVARLNTGKTSRAVGSFIHHLHPDDHAAARAYCQALDLQRGRTPWSPQAVEAPSQTFTPALLAEIEARRLREFGAPLVEQSRTMSSEMLAQLKAAGLV